MEGKQSTSVYLLIPSTYHSPPYLPLSPSCDAPSHPLFLALLASLSILSYRRRPSVVASAKRRCKEGKMRHSTFSTTSIEYVIRERK